MSVCTMASGTVDCSKSWLCMGVCTVSSPMPERKHAFADRIEAPAIPYEPAINKPWPKQPLWAKRLRGLMMARMSSSSSVE